MKNESSEWLSKVLHGKKNWIRGKDWEAKRHTKREDEAAWYHKCNVEWAVGEVLR